MKSLVIVESPSKAETIAKYLGGDYEVIASFGHIRDLPAKNGSVDPEKKFKMIWDISDKSQKHVEQIVKKIKKSDELILATDPDREGEAISWHIYEELKTKKLLKDKPVKRVVFHEITKRAVLAALDSPRDLDGQLVDAYLARRALDYLVGFTLSPILWRKLSGSRSAGRVQSVALRLVTEREDEIDAFKAEEYWTIDGIFAGDQGSVTAKLVNYDGNKLEKLSIKDQKSADKILDNLNKSQYSVANVKKTERKRNPLPPFITSTMQQEASHKFGFSARRTMQIAQQLYEGVNIGGEKVGLITYLRTDSTHLAQEATVAIRSFIKSDYGDQYLTPQVMVYKSKAKNAQEAHEAIRPTDVKRSPKSMSGYLTEEQLKLYKVIWARATACQMASAVFDQTTLEIGGNGAIESVFRATQSILKFDGFLRVYEDIEQEPQKKGSNLPDAKQGDALNLEKILPEQHFTQPPPRYNEGSIIKKLEELGIGRPSTYASIINTLRERSYVNVEKRQLIPNFRGRAVVAFLKQYFEKYVKYDFTAHLEEQLDEVSNGSIGKLKILQDFWQEFDTQCNDAGQLKVSEVIDILNEALKSIVFKDEKGQKCPKCPTGMLSIKFSKHGVFLGCNNYPDCDHVKNIDGSGESAENTDDLPAKFENKVIGVDPKDDLEITLRKGPYGFYLQWGEQVGKKKPKRVAVPKGQNVDNISLDNALTWGSLPRVVGVYPGTDKEITAAIGRFGPYIKYGDRFISLRKQEFDVYTVKLDQAVQLIDKTPEKSKKVTKK